MMCLGNHPGTWSTPELAPRTLCASTQRLMFLYVGKQVQKLSYLPIVSDNIELSLWHTPTSTVSV